jgi:predicted nucleotide-binding protein
MATALGPDSGTLQSFRDVNYHIGVWTGAPGEKEEDARYFASQVQRASALIDAAIYELEFRANASDSGDRTAAAQALSEGPIFVVHGRDNARKYELVRLLDRTTGRDVQVLHEQANRGATILEKLERHVQAAGYAVVLLTGDDEGRLRGKDDLALNARARQNVIFELGVFLGSLGRSRVAVLFEDGVELPSDLDGLVYIPLDSAGGWRVALLKELVAAGIAVDHSRMP